MRESEFRSRLAAHMRGHGAHCQPIETLTANGVPDLELCWQGRTAWIELKMARPSVTLRPQQLVWSINRRAAGGRIALLALLPDNRFAHVTVPSEVRELETTDSEEPQFRIPHLGCPTYPMNAAGVLDFMKAFLHS